MPVIPSFIPGCGTGVSRINRQLAGTFFGSALCILQLDTWMIALRESMQWQRGAGGLRPCLCKDREST